MLRVILGIYLLSAIVFSGAARTESANNQSIINQLAPQFTLPDTRDRLYSLSDWKGKLIILNFWATWCAPCKKEIPALNAMQQEYGSDGLQMVGVAIDNKQAVNEFNEFIPIGYVNLIGGTDAVKLVMQYGNKAGVLPYTVVINQTGEIVSVAKGLLTTQYLRNTIEKHL